MKIAILSDIHANHLALEAVLEDASQRGVQRYWFLGDAIGYGPDPFGPLQWLQDTVAAEDWVLGNHEAIFGVTETIPALAETLELEQETLLAILRYEGEKAIPEKRQKQSPQAAFAASLDMAEDCLVELTKHIRRAWDANGNRQILSIEQWAAVNGQAKKSLQINREALSLKPELLSFCIKEITPQRAAPHCHHLDGVNYILVHSGQTNHLTRYIYPWPPDGYKETEFNLLSKIAAESGFPQVQCFGHTHVPALVFPPLNGENVNSVKIIPEKEYQLKDNLVLLNPGSVGQPRHQCQKAAYAILDTEERTVIFLRVPYNWEEARRRLLARNYPESLAHRLKNPSLPSDTPAEWHKHFRQVCT
jgi:predicted phosphodiesterase